MFSKDSDEIDDLFQEILIRLWKGYNSFRAESDVRTWIYRVSLNCCLNADKKKKNLSGERVSLSVDIDPFEDTNDRALQTKRLYARINQLGLVDRAIILLWLEGLSYEENQLGLVDRAIILLWLEGLSYEEIGAIVGISVKNVSFQLHRIKEEIKKSHL